VRRSKAAFRMVSTSGTPRRIIFCSRRRCWIHRAAVGDNEPVLQLIQKDTVRIGLSSSNQGPGKVLVSVGKVGPDALVLGCCRRTRKPSGTSVSVMRQLGC
jgi:hypothetical protein